MCVCVCERRVDDRARAVRGRQPAEVRAEEELRHQAEEEHRGRVDEDPEQPAAAVDPRVPVSPRDHPERHPDDDRDDHRVEGQLECRGAVLDDDVPDRPPVGDRGAEVPLRDVPQVVAVLDEDRLVVAELVLDLVDDLWRHVSAERCGDRVSRRDPHEQEDEREHDEDHRHHEREPRQCIPSERSPSATSHGRLVSFVHRRSRRERLTLARR